MAAVRVLAWLTLLSAGQTPASAAPTDCVGTALVSQDVWTLAREVDKATQITHVPREFTSSCAQAFFAIVRSGAVQEAIDDCALGVAALAAHAMPEAEIRFGTEVALEYFQLYERIVRDYGHLRREAGFSWDLETHQSAGYPLLLGLRPQGCAGTGLKVYVYETEFAQRTIGCSQGMFASEVFVHRFLLHSACRTEDPEEADFFFVPVYAACVMTKERKNAAEMDEFYKGLVRDGLPYFHRRGGRDHIFLWSSETYDFPSWLDHIHTSVFLSVEAHPIECTDFDFFDEATAANFGASCKHCPWCFSDWKDVMIPGFVEKWSIGKMAAVEQAFEDRTYTGCYHGADSDHLAIYHYANTTVRNDLQTLRDTPNVSVGFRFPMINDYFKRIGQCHFCFVPKGLGYWSNRLYEIMFGGCIPVLLSDNVGLPFEHVLDWTTFSLKWPMGGVSPELISYLEGLLRDRRDFVEELHRNVRRNRCWFDYNSADPECSPYVGILTALERRKAAFPRMPARHWGSDRRGRWLAE